MPSFNLLSVEADAKTKKGKRHGFLTGILYLAPHTIASKKSLCPYSTPQCRELCLYSAGFGRFPTVQEGRIRRTQLYLKDPQTFLTLLDADILSLRMLAVRRDLIPAIRLNGTSDIMWERLHLHQTNKTLFDTHPNVIFYDYTKIPNRDPIFQNYHLVFSHSGEDWTQCLEELRQGKNIAVVFPHDKPLPTYYNGLLVMDGDEHDLRFLDTQAVVGLRAKGKARNDRSGFVQITN